MCGTKFIVHGKIGLNKNRADKEICRKVSWELEMKANKNQHTLAHLDKKKEQCFECNLLKINHRGILQAASLIKNSFFSSIFCTKIEANDFSLSYIVTQKQEGNCFSNFEFSTFENTEIYLNDSIFKESRRQMTARIINCLDR